MSNRTIKAPGVEIFEHDMSEYTTISEGTHVLIAGFAQKGEDYEPYQLTSRSSWLKFYGPPTNEAEEYFYAAANEVLDKGGYLHSVKIPYSNDIKGIYAAAKFNIEQSRELLELDETGDFFLNLDGTPNEDINPGDRNDDAARLMKQYAGLKNLGINSISKIAPQGQDFLSYDLVEEYENGESMPRANTIYIVDKTRAIYGRATKVDDVQPNRDARSCLGIVPVITTMANTAWFQKRSTGLTAKINELYQPIRSLKTITFPAGAASAAEYQPTYFKRQDMAVDIIQPENSYDRSLSEMAAMAVQSCLVNGNMVDGKFAPFVCNEVAVIVFKAYISTEDGKIDFDIVEQFVGSLDPNSRNEKGLANYIGTIINNNSDYIYFFSNLSNPKTVLKADHAFVAGSNSSFREVEDMIKDDEDYIAAQTFGGYTARMLGFDDNDDYESYKAHIKGSLNSFYNQDAKQKIAITDQIIYGGSEFFDNLTKDIGAKVESGESKYAHTSEESEAENIGAIIHSDLIEQIFLNKKIVSTENYITDKPSCAYRIGFDPDTETVFNGKIDFKIISPKSAFEKMNKKDDSDTRVQYLRKQGDEVVNYVPDSYEYSLRMGMINDEGNRSITDLLARKATITSRDIDMADFKDVEIADYTLPIDFQDEDLYQLTIFNSTDYIRAITDFEDLINVEACAKHYGDINPNDDTDMEILRERMTKLLIINSMEKTAKFKVRLRDVKKAQAALDRLDDTFATYVQTTSADETGNYTARVYIRDLYNSLSSMGSLKGISIVDETAQSDSSAVVLAASAKSDALGAKLDEMINPDATKSEKAAPGKKDAKAKKDATVAKKDANQKIIDNLGDYPFYYAKIRVYLRHKLFAAYKAMYAYLTDTLDDCAYAADRYLQVQQSIDDSNIMLGFYPEMAEPIITYTEIAQSINKMFDTFADLNATTIDVVCDAGISNIAQFVKQVYDPSADDGEDVGGIYEPVKYAGWYKFNKNTDISYWKTIVFKWNTFCKSIRKDCMFCTEGPRHMVLTGNKQIVRKSKKDTSVDINILPYLTKITGFNTSYGAGYLNWYKTISDYTGDILWIPPSIIAAGTYIITDRDYNWWDAPAGMKRGVVDMADTSFNPTQRQAGEIYDVSWNYAINYQGNYINGIIQEGQKTFQSYHSAFDRINVRRLFLRCERYVYFASRAFLYEPNTATVRQRYVDTITPFFESIKQRGGMYDFIIICDDSNNTPETIDRNELHVKIGIQPVRTIEFILVDFVASRTGSDWSELESI